ncbi:MAG: hypothetical protein AAF467_19125 [Actinomycetota bacterium]
MSDWVGAGGASSGDDGRPEVERIVADTGELPASLLADVNRRGVLSNQERVPFAGPGPLAAPPSAPPRAPLHALRRSDIAWPRVLAAGGAAVALCVVVLAVARLGASETDPAGSASAVPSGTIEPTGTTTPPSTVDGGRDGSAGAGAGSASDDRELDVGVPARDEEAADGNGAADELGTPGTPTVTSPTTPSTPDTTEEEGEPTGTTADPEVSTPPTTIEPGTVVERIDLGGFEEGATVAPGEIRGYETGSSFGQWQVTKRVDRVAAVDHGGFVTAGGHRLHLRRSGGVSRTITDLEPGEPYRLKLRMARHFGDSDAPPPSFRVTIAGEEAVITTSEPSDTRSELVFVAFTPQSTTVTLAIEGIAANRACCGVIVDAPVVHRLAS